MQEYNLLNNLPCDVTVHSYGDKRGIKTVVFVNKGKNEWRWYFMQIGYKNNGKISGYGLNASSSHKLLPPPHTKSLLLFLLTSIPSSSHKLLPPPPPRPHHPPRTKSLLLLTSIPSSSHQVPPPPHTNSLFLLLLLSIT